MRLDINQLLQVLFGKKLLAEVSLDELYELVTEYPSFNAGHYLLSKKLQNVKDPRFLEETRRTALYFTNPLWLQYLLDHHETDASMADHSIEESWKPEKEEPGDAYQATDWNPESRQAPNPGEEPQPYAPLEEASLQPFARLTPAEFVAPSGEWTGTPEEKNPPLEEPPPISESISDSENSVGFPEPELPISHREPEKPPAVSPEFSNPPSPHEPPAQNKRNTYFFWEEQYKKQHEVSGEPGINQETFTPAQQTGMGREETPWETLIHSVLDGKEKPPQSREADFHSEKTVAETLWDPTLFAAAAPLLEGLSFPPAPEKTKVAQSPLSSNTSIPPGTASPALSNLPVEAVAPEPIAETSLQAAAPVFEDSTAEEPELGFTPYHTVDYFASIGVRFIQEEAPEDRFGQQLKSFTDWLKALKRMSTPQIDMDLQARSDSAIQDFAQHSLEDKEILTESMAKVLALQGRQAEAVEVYNKLSLLNPSKSAYFAACIEELKAKMI